MFRSAVQREYRTTLSTARLAAGTQGRYTIEEVSSVRILGTGEIKQIKVSFKASLNARSEYTEVIDLLTPELLKVSNYILSIYITTYIHTTYSTIFIYFGHNSALFIQGYNDRGYQRSGRTR